MKKTILLFLAVLSSLVLLSQSKYLNQVKYWKYRYAFKEQFISIGTGEGKSLPATQLDLNSEQLDYNNAGVQLGWYIGVLATEYRISSSKMYLPITEFVELNPSQSLIELYRALKTLERLDANAELKFECDSLPLNGFFIQQDISKEKEKSEVYFKRGSIEPDIDQYLNLFFGLALVKKYIPEGTIVKGEDLNVTATNQALRMLEYLEKNKWKIVNPCEQNEENIFTYGEYDMRPYSLELSAVYSYFKNDEDQKLEVPFFRRKFWNVFKGNGSSVFKRNRVLLSRALANSSKKNTGKKLKKLSLEHNWLLYPLSNSLFFEEQNEFGKDGLVNLSEGLLNTVPESGVFAANQNDWNSVGYFFTSKKQKENNQFLNEDIRYNGLDFLLFYNVWFIHRTGL